MNVGYLEYNRMRELNVNEIEQVSGGIKKGREGGISFSEGAGLILALGAFGGPITFAFAFPIATALFYVSP